MLDSPFADWWVLPLLVLGCFLVPLVPTIAAALWERRLVWPYVPVRLLADRGRTDERIAANLQAIQRTAGDDSVLPLTEEAARAIAAAESLGFEPLGVFRDGKGPIYRIRYDFWLAPERDVLVLIGGGTLMSFQVRAIWLMTRLADGRCLVTLNSQTASEFDLAHMMLEAVLGGADFGTLLMHHRGRVDDAPVPAVPYTSDDPLGDHLAFRARRIDRLEELGLARFLDWEQTAWRYTIKGALKLSVRAHLNALRRIVFPDACFRFFRGRNR
jgi:hypothetical protein